MKKIFFIACILSGGSAFAQNTSTLQTRPQNTLSPQTDPAGKEKEYMSIEEYDRRYNNAPQPEIFTLTEEAAEFPGGMIAMGDFIKANIKYPEEAVKQKLEGKCFLKFVVRDNGEISDITILKGVPGCPDCDQAAIAVVKQMPLWKPAKLSGKSVHCYYNLPINFKL